eukprot:869-Heterococcus_DN1.PRE.1
MFVDLLALCAAAVAAAGVYPGVTTSELDELAAQTAAYMATQHPGWSQLAARISVSNLHKNTCKVFSENIEQLHKYVHPKTGAPASLISDEVYEIVQKHKDTLNSAIINDRDYTREVLPAAHRWQGGRAPKPHDHEDLHPHEPEDVHTRYTNSVQCWDTAATAEQLLPAQCQGGQKALYTCDADCCGDIMLSGRIFFTATTALRASMTLSSSAHASPSMQGALAWLCTTFVLLTVYLEPWHADIFAFLDLRKNHGNELERARDLFYGLWIPDLFMHRVEKDGDWSLMCPNECPGLPDVHSAEFDALYTRRQQATVNTTATRT